MSERRRQRPSGAHPVCWLASENKKLPFWVVQTVSNMASTFKGKLPSRVLDKPTPTTAPYLLMVGLRGGNHVFTEETSLPAVTESDSIVIADGSKSGFDEVAEVGSGVTMGKNIAGHKYVELPYLRVANVQDGHLNLNTIKTVKVRLDEVEHYRLEPGDVLMTEGGDLDKLGRGTLWEGQIPDCLHQNHIFRVRADRSLLDPRFFSLIVESDIAKRYFTRVAKRTTNLASTNKTQVRAFRFPVPPLDEQKQIAEIMNASKAKAKAKALEQKEKVL